jgi:hypothetical protein
MISLALDGTEETAVSSSFKGALAHSQSERQCPT